MARKSKAFLSRSKAAKKGVRTRAANKKIIEKMYRQLLRIERKERRITNRLTDQIIFEGLIWEIEIGMTYKPAT